MAMAMALSTHQSGLISSGVQPHFASSISSRDCNFGVVLVGVGRSRRNGGGKLLVQAQHDMLGDFGGRDPFPEELESNFGDKTLGNSNTEHQILVPTLAVLSLAEKTIKPLAEGAAPLTEVEAKPLLRKVVGWRLLTSESGFKLQCDWNLKDSESVRELYTRVGAVTDAENCQPEMQTLENNKVRIEIWNPSIAKIDQVETKDLTRRLRTWF